MRVLAFGTFDGIHPGHLDFIRQAKLHGHLTIVVARDETVKQVKHKSAVHNEQERLAALKAVPGVDDAVLGNTGDKYKVVLEHKPDVICLGYDQVAFTDKLEQFLKERGIEAKIVRLKPFRPEKFKSSLLTTG